ncbi:MAG: FixH family protein [Bacteroidia bacterium]|jgi:nitrogen fixation protein FixH
MKLSWGIKIAVLYAGFVILIVTMVSLTMREKVDLVAKDYYAQELSYQDKINKVNRTNALEQPLTWQVQPAMLVLKFPEQFKGSEIAGSIYFFRPSDASMDTTVYVSVDTAGVQVITTAKLNKGVYKMQVNWEANKQTYYNESIITIN